MSKADELLITLGDNTIEHEHVVTDSDSYFVIDPITRVMDNGRYGKNIIMQYDHGSERFTFELPRIVEGHDMSLCNRVLVHWNNTNKETGEENAESTEILDLHVDPNDEDKVFCSWLISRHSTQLVGELSFLVQYKCVEEGETVYEWHTDIYYDIEVKKSRNNGEESVIEYTDILEQWRPRVYSNEEEIAILIENDMLPTVCDDNQILTDGNNNILLRH